MVSDFADYTHPSVSKILLYPPLLSLFVAVTNTAQLDRIFKIRVLIENGEEASVDIDIFERMLDPVRGVGDGLVS
ncbi:hypothetical protein LTS18_003187 [Coniosporium uncinatum]|uniref:Uncharacterized protein n=1 Tax=Coniosporium uncinatum TaxID=93489 RepID=A0ACC3DC22_9PEZI|nr:hypothetical protein LTS18_003187 [Coniosporium uncinatum]